MTLAPVFLALLIYMASHTSAKSIGNDTVDERIVNGIITSISYVPYQAVVFPGPYLCGGSILSQSWIVSAAHCTYGQQASNIRVGVGVNRASVTTDLKLVSSVYNHPAYNPNSKDNDISMLKLQSHLTFTATVQPIQIASSVPPTDSYCLVSGYGDLYENGPTSDVLRSVNVRIISTASTYYYPGTITNNMLLAGDLQKDSCQGDSGGPLAYQNKLVGIVSFGYGCAEPNYPGVYTKVSNYIPWITSYMSSY